VREAPFVVVPGHHLDQRAVDDCGQLQIDDGGTWVADDVGGDQRILRDTEDAVVAGGGCLLPERLVDLCGRGRPAGDEDDVRDGAHRA
jgi:hypothetical protein